LSLEAVIERGGDDRSVVQATCEMVEGGGVGGLDAFEPSGVQTIVDDAAGPIAGDRTATLPAGLDHPGRADHLDPFVVAISPTSGAVDLDERSSR
jgi:hypothetical protein